MMVILLASGMYDKLLPYYDCRSDYLISSPILETRSLYFAPNSENFLQGVGEIIGDFRDTVLSVVNLVPDGYFDAFTRPVINGEYSLHGDHYQSILPFKNFKKYDVIFIFV